MSYNLDRRICHIGIKTDVTDNRRKYSPELMIIAALYDAVKRKTCKIWAIHNLRCIILTGIPDEG